MDFNTKFLAFSDLHVDIMPDAVARLQIILEEAEHKNVDFILNLGDFMYPDLEYLKENAPESIELREKHAWFVCDRDDEKRTINKMIKNNKKPMFNVLGNHDMDSCSKKTACKYFSMPSPHYYFDYGNVRFIVIDTNYIKDNNKLIDFDHCNYRYYKRKQTTWLTDEQLDFIEKTAENSPYPCVLLSHSSLGDNDLSINNKEELYLLIEKINKNKRCIILSLNGHSHIDGACVRKGVPFVNINSASNIWIGHEYDCTRYSETISRFYPHLKGCAPYWDVLFAIIEITPESIKINGRKTSFVGPSPYELGHPCDGQYPITSFIKDRIIPIAQMKDTDSL